MKKINVLILFLLLGGFIANAQVKDISVTISPAAEYTWWDNNAGINDGALIGGKVGFGFGEYMELRGVYLQSYDLQTNFENFGLANYNNSLFKPQDITFTRWGGEFKANLGSQGLKPYLTIGTGIQNIDVKNGETFEQIYASLGLGMKFNFTKRAIFLIEAKNTMYNFNAGANLLTSADKTAFGVTNSDFGSDRLSNWAVQGALQFYLGGRKPGTMTELDKAYLNKFSGGLRGIQPIIEPGLGYIEFDKNSLFRDTWMVGGYAGLDFSEYIGIRAFYFQSVKELDINSDFDKLSMYGLELRARLNDNAGVTPYISLGGGYLNSEDNYLGKNGVSVKGGEFASGGLGLNIPLGKRVLINGGAKAMITSTENTIDISVPDDLQTHIMYNAGIKFTLGKKARSTDDIYMQNLNRDVDDRMAENNLKVQKMKSEYQDKVAALEEELNQAYETKDVDKAVEILEDKKEAEKSLKEVEKLEKAQEVQIAEKAIEKPVVVPVVIAEQPAVKAAVVPVVKEVPATNTIQMSPAEFQSLVVEILKAVREKTEIKTMPDVQIPAENQQNKQQIELLNQRIEMLEKLLFDINSKLGVSQQITIPPINDQVSNDQIRELSKNILDELDKLERKVDKNADQIGNNSDQMNYERSKPQTQTVVVTPIDKDNVTDAYITAIDDNGEVISNQKVTEIDTNNTLIYKNSAAMLGVNFGGATTTNLGVRLHYDFRKLPLEFMPEIYFGLGSSTSFGISGNVIYPIALKNENVAPYVGVGLGISRIDKDLRGNYNIIIGTGLPFLNKNLSVDYTMRNTFDYNQLAITYKLPF